MVETASNHGASNARSQPIEKIQAAIAAFPLDTANRVTCARFQSRLKAVRIREGGFFERFPFASVMRFCRVSRKFQFAGVLHCFRLLSTIVKFTPNTLAVLQKLYSSSLTCCDVLVRLGSLIEKFIAAVCVLFAVFPADVR